MRGLLKLKLKILSKLILRKYHPRVIGITGSIGKTSAKEAVCLVLDKRFKVRASYKNYNNEFGLPLTIIGVQSAGKSLLGWSVVILKAVSLILFKDKNYPEILVLEMGVDRPGDMAYLCSIISPEIGIETAISYSHLEYFGSVANIKKEKQVLIESVDNKGLSILNYDNEYTREMASVSRAKVLTYGFQSGAGLQVQDLVYNFSKGDYDLSGIHFKMSYDGSIVPVYMKNVLSETAVYAALAGVAVGLHFGLNLVELAQILLNFNLPHGRMNLLPGIKNTFIIDDTYNSSPEACLAALEVLGKLKIGEDSKKFAVLGDMAEIGSYTEEGHELVGKKVFEVGVACLVTVGAKSIHIAAGAKEAGLKDDYIFHFDTAEEAGRFIQDRIASGDVILVKGSQSMRMEKVVLEIMAEPERAKELLVRQDEAWK